MHPSTTLARKHPVSPTWGMLGLLVGTLIAVATVPDVIYFDSGALILSASALTLGLLWGIVAAGWANPAALFRTEHLLLFGLFYWILFDPIQGIISLRVPADAVITGYLSIATFAAALWLGSLWFPPSTPVTGNSTALALDASFLFWIGVFSFLIGTLRQNIGCAANLECVVNTFFTPRFQGGVWVVKDFGQWDTVLQQLTKFGYLLMPIAIALRHVEGRMTWRVWLLAALALMFALLVMRGGGRRGLGTIVLISSLVWILLRERITLKHLLGLAAIGAALLIMMDVILNYRGVGIARIFDDDTREMVGDRPGLAVDKNFRFLTHITNLVPEYYPHTGGNGILYHLTVMIPGSILPGKITGHAFNLPAILGMPMGRGYSWTCSAVGDLYLIGGYLGVATGGLLFGFMARRCSQLLVSDTTVEGRVTFALASMAMFLGLRALHEMLIIGLALVAWKSLLWGRAQQLARAAENRRLRANLGALPLSGTPKTPFP